MRKYHRWVAVVATIFLLFVSVTGVILQFQHAAGEEDEEEHEGRPASELTLALPTSQYAAMLSRTVDAARTRAPGAEIAAVSLQARDHAVVGVVRLPGDPPREIKVDARTGQLLSDGEGEEESLVRRIHSGEVFGEPGVVLGVLWGLGLIALLVTGAYMYLDMYRRRRAGGKRGLFW